MAKQEATSLNQFLGLLYAMISGLSVAGISMCRKNLPDLPPSQFVIYRYAGVLCYSLLATVYYQQSILLAKKLTSLLVLRSCVMGLSYLVASYALNYVPITEYSVISGSCPVFTILLARIVLKERCNVIHITCMILTLSGILLVSKLPVIVSERAVVYELSYFGGIALTLLFAFMVAISTIIIRAPDIKAIHSSVIMLYVGAFSVGECAAISSVSSGFEVTDCGFSKWVPVVLFAVGIGADIFVVLSLKHLQASVCIMVSTACNILGSYLWQVLGEYDIPDAYTISGTAVMIFCITLLTFGQMFKSYRMNWRNLCRVMRL